MTRPFEPILPNHRGRAYFQGLHKAMLYLPHRGWVEADVFGAMFYGQVIVSVRGVVYPLTMTSAQLASHVDFAALVVSAQIDDGELVRRWLAASDANPVTQQHILEAFQDHGREST